MTYSDYIRPLTNAVNTRFNVDGIGRMKKIYCRCGCIIGLDSAEMKLKLKLGKELECTNCRNASISRDIDELNSHVGGESVESDW